MVTAAEINSGFRMKKFILRMLGHFSLCVSDIFSEHSDERQRQAECFWSDDSGLPVMKCMEPIHYTLLTDCMMCTCNTLPTRSMHVCMDFVREKCI